MICPTCGTHIPDGSIRCPACHASVGMTIAMPTLQGRWCPSCGAGMGWEDQVCPNCGLPVEPVWGAPSADTAAEAPEEPQGPTIQPVVDETADTRAIPRIESAIPAEDDPTSKVAELEVMPRASRLMVAAVASIALVCGITLFITHPWNPNAYSIKATKEADTSMAGFPGTVESLSGQDNGGGTTDEVLTGDEATLAQLTDAYGRLGRMAQRADENESTFHEVAFGDDDDERTRGKREADALSIDLSNLIEELNAVDVTSGTYVEQRDHLLTLGNWLRNQVDGLCSAWRAVVDAQDVAAEREQIEAALAADDTPEGKNAFRTLFDENYDAWDPAG